MMRGKDGDLGDSFTEEAEEHIVQHGTTNRGAGLYTAHRTDPLQLGDRPSETCRAGLVEVGM